MKSVSGLTDEQFAMHLMTRHSSSIEHGWLPGQKMQARSAYEVYHDVHLHKPGLSEHEHDWTQRPMGSKGWEQRTPCNCLEPPKHRADCTGAQGVVQVQHDHGTSAQKRLWQDLDDSMDVLKSGTFDAKSAMYLEVKGGAAATARAIALMLNPGNPDIDGVRKLAVARWKTRKAA